MPFTSKRISKISFHKKLLKLLLILALLIQSIILTFNYFRGNMSFDSYENFFEIFASRVLIGFISSVIVAYPYVFIIEYLNKIAPWSGKVLKRVVVQFLFTIFISCIVSILVTLIVKQAYPGYNISTSAIVNDVMIYSLTNVILVIILEAWMFYDSGKSAMLEAEILRDNLIKVNYETLKNQIEPHFLFNSMSVLSGLIATNPEKAQKFVKEFTSMYRYIIESIEIPVSKLADEIKFVESYLCLQQMRYGSSLSYSVKLDIDQEKYVLPPMALQVLTENAIKHNIINNENPLEISIYNIQTDIYVKNNIQPKISTARSTGIGLKNLTNRYELVCKRKPSFIEHDNCYTGILPVLNPEFELSSFAQSIDNK